MAETTDSALERAGDASAGSSEMPEAASESVAAAVSADDRMTVEEPMDLCTEDLIDLWSDLLSSTWSGVWTELQAIGAGESAMDTHKRNFERVVQGNPVDDRLMAYVLLKGRGREEWVKELEQQGRVLYRTQNSKVHRSGQCIFFSHKNADGGSSKRPRTSSDEGDRGEDDGWLKITVASVASTRGAVHAIGTALPYKHEGVLRISCSKNDLSLPDVSCAMFVRVAFSGHPDWESLGEKVGEDKRGQPFKYLDLDEFRRPLCLVSCDLKKADKVAATGPSSARALLVRPTEGAATMEDLLAGKTVLNVPDIEINGVSVWKELQHSKLEFQQLREQIQELRNWDPFTSVRADMAEWMRRLDVDEAIEAADLVECRGERISKTITGEPGSTLFVVSTEPALCLNQQADEDEQQKGNFVAFLGRVPVRVKAHAAVGSFLVPSGYSDGRAKCVSSEDLVSQGLRSSVFGVVWALLPPDERGEQRVLAFVCAHPTLPPFGAIPGAEEVAPLSSSLVPCTSPGKVLRPYQEECVEEALKSNKIIHLPTGTGKTLVAARVIDRVLHSQQRVLFIVPRVPLVSQQAEKLRRDCHGSPVVSQLIGKTAGGWRAKQWAACMESSSILVGTPQVFHDAMEDGFLRISDFALIVFDECHHAKKRDPMAMIMRKYFWPALKNASDDAVLSVPQVLGLTASFASGKVDRDGQLEKLRQDLEETLNAAIFSPGGLESICKQDFNKVPYRSLSLPDGSKKSVRERIAGLTSGFDSFLTVEGQKAEEGAMHVLEECGWAGLCAYFNDSIAYQLENKAAELKSWSAQIAAKSQDPTQAASADSMKSKAQQLQDTLAEFRQRVQHVQAELRASTRTQDDVLAPIPSISGKCGALLQLLQQLFESHLDKRQYKGIVFVERVALTWPLAEVINEHFGSAVATAVSGGSSMSVAKQKDRIDSFRRGEAQVLVCTSVLEEGMDVPECEFVVRYSGFDTTIEHIQGAGRARMTHAQIFYFENEPEEEIALAQQLTQCAQDDSLALSPTERAQRVQLKHIPGFYPFSPPGEGAFTLDLDNCVRRFEEYCDRVLGSCSRPSRQFLHSRVEMVAGMEVEKLHTVQYPTLPDYTLVSVSLEDVRQHWGEVAVGILLAEDAEDMPSSEQLLRQFLYTVVVQMYERGHIDRNGYPIAKPVSPTELWLSSEAREAVSEERATFELRSDVFDPSASPSADGVDMANATAPHAADTHSSRRGLTDAANANMGNSSTLYTASAAVAAVPDVVAVSAAGADATTADDGKDRNDLEDAASAVPIGSSIISADSADAAVDTDTSHAHKVSVGANASNIVFASLANAATDADTAPANKADADTADADTADVDIPDADRLDAARAHACAVNAEATHVETTQTTAAADSGFDFKGLQEGGSTTTVGHEDMVPSTDVRTIAGITTGTYNCEAEVKDNELEGVVSTITSEADVLCADNTANVNARASDMVTAFLSTGIHSREFEQAASTDVVKTDIGGTHDANAANAHRPEADSSNDDLANVSVDRTSTPQAMTTNPIDGIIIVSDENAHTTLDTTHHDGNPPLASLPTCNAISTVETELKRLGKKMESFLEVHETSDKATNTFGCTIRRANAVVLARSSGSRTKREAKHAAFAKLLSSDEWRNIKVELLEEHTRLCQVDVIPEVTMRLQKLGMSLKMEENGNAQHNFGYRVLVDGLELGSSSNQLNKRLAKRLAYSQVLERIDWHRLEHAPTPRDLSTCLVQLETGN